VLWEQRFAELNMEIHKHCGVPHRWKENPQLGKWVAQQRMEYRYLKEGKSLSMTDERIRKLEGIGFEWSLRPELSRRQVQWEQRFAELKQYKEIHQHCNVPGAWKENRLVGKWVAKQRTDYRLLKEGKSSRMTDERIRKLEGIGFEWSLRPGHSRRPVPWEQRFAELKQYKDVHNHCNVPSAWKDNPPLGKWVAYQRRKYRLLMEGKSSSVIDERIRRLESIGFEWSLQPERGGGSTGLRS